MSDNTTPESPASDTSSAQPAPEPSPETLQQPAPEPPQPASPEPPSYAPPAYGAADPYAGAAPATEPGYAAHPVYGAPAPGYGAAPAPYGAAPAPYGAAPAPYAAAPAPYGAAPAPYGTAPAYGGYPAQPKTNALAIVSLISSIVGLVLLPFVGSIAGVVTGHISLSQIKKDGEGGRGMALTGTILGWVGIGLCVLGIIVLLALIPFLFAIDMQTST